MSINKIELPESYQPSSDEEYMSSNQLAYFHKKLEDWKQELLDESRQTLNNLRDENWNGSDIGDRASVEIDASIELRTRDRYRKLIDKIDAAILRIKDGTYGYCNVTKKEIGLERLQARPVATLSIEAQEQHENYERTHIDEKDDN